MNLEDLKKDFFARRFDEDEAWAEAHVEYDSYLYEEGIWPDWPYYCVVAVLKEDPSCRIDLYVTQ